MNQIGTKTIETERLILRKYTLDDIQSMFDNWASDPEVSKYVGWDVHDTIDVTTEIITSWINKYENPLSFNWAVVLKDTNELVGSIEVIKVKEKDGFGEIGYCYSKKTWGQGIGTEALRAVLNYVFNEADFRIIEIRYLENNPASGKVMEKAGLKYETKLRDRTVDKNGLINDILIYSITKDEWSDLK